MPSSRAMRRIDQPRATNLEIASCSCTLSMLAIVAAHTPVSPDYFAALWPPARWYTLKPFISTRGGTLSLTADNISKGLYDFPPILSPPPMVSFEQNHTYPEDK